MVFREGSVSQPRPSELLDDVADDLAVLSRERFPLQTPLNLSALQYQLRNDVMRGLIAEGEVIGRKTKKVKFTTYPIPVMSITITYYRPR